MVGRRNLLLMWQNNNKEYIFRDLYVRAVGITLVELLVAMAILSIILTGLVAVFVSAIETTHQGYMTKEGYTTARVAMEVLTRDLERACTLTDQGEKLQFYATPTSLTFLTVLDNGEVGRVTYFIAPSPNIPPFQTYILVNLEEGSSRNRIEKERLMKKLVNRLPVTNLDLEIGGNADSLQESLSAGCLERVRDLLVNPQNKPIPDMSSEVPEPLQDSAELGYNVMVQPLALFRIEERGVKNLKDMKIRKGNLQSSIEFLAPEVNPSIADNPLGIQGDFVDRLISVYMVEELGSRVDVPVVSPLEFQTPDITLSGDFRNFVDDPNYQVIKEDFVKAILEVRKIQLRLYLMQIYDARKYTIDWYNLMRNPLNSVAFVGGGGVLNLSPYIWSYDLTIPRKDQILLCKLFSYDGRDPLLQNIDSVGLFNYWESVGMNPADYILADGFGAHAFWIDENAGIQTCTDLLYPGAMFSYQSEENETSMYFNDVRGIPLMNHYLSQDFSQLSVEDINCLTAYLDRLWAVMIGTDPSKNAPFGSLFFERLPVRITVRAWIVIEKPQPGVSDFVRWFSQSIDVPCGLRAPQPRSLPAGM